MPGMGRVCSGALVLVHYAQTDRLRPSWKGEATMRKPPPLLQMIRLSDSRCVRVRCSQCPPGRVPALGGGAVPKRRLRRRPAGGGTLAEHEPILGISNSLGRSLSRGGHGLGIGNSLCPATWHAPTSCPVTWHAPTSCSTTCHAVEELLGEFRGCGTERPEHVVENALLGVIRGRGGGGGGGRHAAARHVYQRARARARCCCEPRHPPPAVVAAGVGRSVVF
jgi:hypothetical protein